MDKKRPYKVIAEQFEMSDESAKYFLGRVQKSFKSEKPPHKVILTFIEAQGFEFLLTPYEIAAMMHASGVWPHELNSPPPIVEDEEDIYF